MIPGINRCPLTSVFRKVEAILRADPVLSSVVQEWQTFPDHAAENTQPAPGRVALTLWPVWGPQDWASVESQKAELLIQVGITMPASDATDYLDLWYAIVRACYPGQSDPTDPEKNRTVRTTLESLRCVTGILTFQAPSVAAVEASEQKRITAITAKGAIKVSVRLLVDP